MSVLHIPSKKPMLYNIKYIQVKKNMIANLPFILISGRFFSRLIITVRVVILCQGQWKTEILIEQIPAHSQTSPHISLKVLSINKCFYYLDKETPSSAKQLLLPNYTCYSNFKYFTYLSHFFISCSTQISSLFPIKMYCQMFSCMN